MERGVAGVERVLVEAGRPEEGAGRPRVGDQRHGRALVARGERVDDGGDGGGLEVGVRAEEPREPGVLRVAV